MYRTHNCGELRISDLGKQVTLSGWVQKSRDKGFLVWIDLRDRYGISQLIFDEERTSKEILKNAKSLGREFVIQITGEEGDTLSDYYVNFVANGVWKETVGPGVKLGLDNSTMPHALINNNNGTFTFAEQTYTNRVAGDETTNPAPSFVGQKISNLTFFQNRFGIISGQNLIMTENGEYYNFYVTTGTDVLDTDPIDIAASGTTVNKLYNTIDFNEQLLLFSAEAQYILESSGDSITPVSYTHLTLPTNREV